MTRYEQIMAAVNPTDSSGAPMMPTPEQRAVIESEASSILVVAGAGSGKTRTMSNRIAYWVGSGRVEPSQVLGLTFTRKAAGELDSRVSASLAALDRAGLGPAHAAASPEERARAQLELPTISTYNSFAADIAASYGLLVGADPAARLMTEAERYQLMEAAVDEIGEAVASRFASARSTVVNQALALSAALIDNGKGVEEAREFYAGRQEILEAIVASQEGVKVEWKKNLGDDAALEKTYQDAWKALKSKGPKVMEDGQLLCDLVEEYYRLKAREGLSEFADQVATAVKVLEAVPALRDEIASRYGLVLLDEYQDTSVSQARLLSLALSGGDPANRSVAAVGDPNQAIYGWRGASANAFADFSRAFGSLGQPAVFSLQTTFRNDTAILDAANAVAAHIETEAVDVGRLRPREGAGAGRVVEIRPLRREDSYRAMALRMRDRMAEIGAEEGRPAQMAVLCRKRSYIDQAAKALGAAGVPYEIVGGQSLLDRPEVTTVRAALEVAVNPHRGDWLARLLAFANVGISDMRALSSFARARAAARLAQIEGGEHFDPRRETSLAEGLDELSETVPKGMSVEGHERLRWLAGVVREIRAMVHAPLGELAHRVARLLGLYLAAASRTEGARRVATSLDAFSSAASEYSANHPQAGVADFLAWLDAVEAREHGGEAASGAEERLEGPEVEVNPGVVQIMTVHASKGLEWRDVVALPEMVDGEFDEPRRARGLWPVNAGVLPYPLRADARYLPRFSPSAPAKDSPERAWPAIEEYVAFTAAQRRHESQEARRLAYVAMTRPQRELLVVGYGVRDASAAAEKVLAGKPVPILARSAFLADVACEPVGDASWAAWKNSEGEEAAQRLCYQCPSDLAPQEFLGLLDDDEQPIEGPAPIPDFSKLDGHTYPGQRLRPPIAEDDIDREAAEKFLDLREREVEVVLAELAAAKAGRKAFLARPYLTATDVVALASDPQAFEADMARPIPREPSRKARVGTQVHRAIADSYLLAPRLDLDETNGAVAVADAAQVDALFATYARSRWARYRPILVEAPVSVVVAGHVVRCTIDAVLDTSTVRGMRPVTIVDWKTGTRPGRAQLASRQMQLALYRLAYSKVSGVPLEDIGAYFVYLDPEGVVTELEAGELEEKEILALVEAGTAQISDPRLA